MKKIIKTVLFFSLIIIVIFICSYFFFLNTIKGAFGPECVIVNSYSKREYLIREHICHGFAGPGYKKIKLFENGIQVAQSGKRIDSCTFRFFKNNRKQVEINICD